MRRHFLVAIGVIALMPCSQSHAQECVTFGEIITTNRSEDGPLEGPYYPGETISMCMNVDNFQVNSFSCQWLQGVVPVFGDGWDPVSFDSTGMPMNCTMNGGSLPAENLNGAGYWDWWDSVSMHIANPYLNVGDFDGNGTLDLCSNVQEPNCMGPGLIAGCCSPCWTDTLGTILPPGWFSSGVDGICPLTGHPSVDWGDGNTCNGPTGPWSFCFDLKVRSDDCLDGLGGVLSAAFFTFTDNEIGASNGGTSPCTGDTAYYFLAETCCPVPNINGTLAICDDNPAVLDAGEGYQEYLWTTGDTTQMITVTDPGTFGITVTNEYGCMGSDEVDINMVDSPLPDLPVDTSFCTGDSILLDAGPGFHSYAWSNGDSTQTIMVATPGDYIVTVTDITGCEGTDVISITEFDNPVVDLGPDTLEVAGSAMLDAGNPGAMYLWSTGETTQTIVVAMDSTYSITVTDVNGCTAEDSIYVDVTTGVIHLSDTKNVIIYPNPNSGVFCLVAELSEPGELSVAVFNNLGLEVYSLGSQIVAGSVVKHIHMVGEPNGLYMISISISETTYVGRIVLTK